MRAAAFAFAALFVPAAVVPTAAQEAPALDVMVADDYGRYLVGPDGRPVYSFVTEDVRGGNEITPIVACQDRCLEDWPLVTLDAPDFLVAEGVDPVLAEPLEWEGDLVLVYDSRVMFYFHRDEPGEPPQGQEIHEWGGWWYLVRPDGTLIQSGVAPDPEPEG
jgi:predicted lipoprotein with Yx(FWY)xxD motif